VNLGWERTSSLLLLDSEGLRRYRDDVFIIALTLVCGCQKEHLVSTTHFCLCLTGILLWSCVQTRLGSQRESTMRAPGSNLTPREGRLLHLSRLWDAMRKVSGGQVTFDVCVFVGDGPVLCSGSSQAGRRTLWSEAEPLCRPDRAPCRYLVT